MASKHSPYTQLNYQSDSRRMGRDWQLLPKLEDLPKGYQLVQSLSEGRLQLSLPLLFTQAGKRSFDGQFLGAAVLGELLPSHEVFWLELPPAPCISDMGRRQFKSCAARGPFEKLEAAQAFYFRAFHQLPNAFSVASRRDPGQHDTWLRDSTPCARHQQRGAGAGNLPSDAVGMPIRILYEPIAREEWLPDGESDPSTGCQQILMLGQTVYAGSLERIWKLPRRHFLRKIAKSTNKECRRFYRAVDTKALAKEFQSNTPQELAATLRDSNSRGTGQALVAWRDIREMMAQLRRLDHILDSFKPKKTQQAAWTVPDNLQAVADEAEAITQRLASGPLKLGRKVSGDGKPSIPFKEPPISKATSDGVKTEAILEQALSGRGNFTGSGGKRKLVDTEYSIGEWYTPGKSKKTRGKSRKIEDPTAEEE